MSNSLHRTLLSLLILVLLATSVLRAQYTGQARTSRMRSVGILAVDQKGKARLFPIVLYTEGKYYDASLYEARPVPLAIAGDILYQIQKDGDLEGTFTVETAMRSSNQWWAEGLWKPLSEGGNAVQKTGPSHPSADDDRPVLRRHPGSARPSGTSASVSHSEERVTGDTATEKREEQDPNRPTLRRGKPAHEQQPDIPASGRAVSAAPVVSAKPETFAGGKVFIAVADAGRIETRPYEYKWSDKERQQDLAVLNDMAVSAIHKAATGRSDLRGTDAIKLTGVEVRALDPDYSSRPIEIFTATVTGATSRTWLPPGSVMKSVPAVTITLVARKDGEGRLNQIFAMISDPLMLDVRPSMQYIGAVDADGSGRAQLLFREQVDVNAYSYVLYRATPYELVKAFETKRLE